MEENICKLKFNKRWVSKTYKELQNSIIIIIIWLEIGKRHENISTKNIQMAHENLIQQHRVTTPNAGEDVEKFDYSYISGGNIK